MSYVYQDSYWEHLAQNPKPVVKPVAVPTKAAKKMVIKAQRKVPEKPKRLTKVQIINLQRPGRFGERRWGDGGSHGTGGSVGRTGGLY